MEYAAVYSDCITHIFLYSVIDATFHQYGSDSDDDESESDVK